MRWLRPFALVFLPILTLFLPSCGSNSTTGANPGRHPSGIGPFDRNGNYVEAWADTPSKWGRKSGSSIASNPSTDVETPAVASNEEPPPDAVPLPAAGSVTAPSVVKSKPPVRSANEVVVATLSKKTTTASASTKAKPKSSVEARATAKKTTTTAKTTVAKTKAKPTAKELAAAKAKAKSKTATTAATKTKAKTATASTTAKKKPASRYTVKKGDNLVKIADRHNTTAAAIKKANGLKTGVIAPGKTLVIPKG